MRSLTARINDRLLLAALGLDRLDGAVTATWTEHGPGGDDGPTVTVGLGIRARNNDGLWHIPPARRRQLGLEDYGRPT